VISIKSLEEHSNSFFFTSSSFFLKDLNHLECRKNIEKQGNAKTKMLSNPSLAQRNENMSKL